MNNDKAFYDIWEKEDQPYDEDQAAVLEFAKEKGQSYPINKKLYMVRGYETFVCHSGDVEVRIDKDTGLRTIVVKNAKMVKYTANGERKE